MMLSWVQRIFVLIVFAQFSSVAAAKTLDYVDIYQLSYASHPGISPNGKWVAYFENGFDIKKDKKTRSLWLQNIKDGQKSLLSGVAEQPSEFTWSGNRLAYVANKTGTSQIHIYDHNDRTNICSTNLPKRPSSLSWSRDNKMIAYIMSVGFEKPSIIADLQPPEGAKWAENPKEIDQLGYRFDGLGYTRNETPHLFVVNNKCTDVKQISSGKRPHAGPFAGVTSQVSWSHDNQWVIMSLRDQRKEEADSRHSNIYAYRIKDKLQVEITETEGSEQRPKVSPDGKWIAYLGWEGARDTVSGDDLFLIPREGGKAVNLTEKLDREGLNFHWSPDSKSLMLLHYGHGQMEVSKVTLKSEITPFMNNVDSGFRAYIGSKDAISFSKDGKQYAATRFHADQLSEVYVGKTNRPEKTARQITNLSAFLKTERQLGKVEENWTTSRDGTYKIQSWLIKPPGFDANKKYPLIVEAHGGPFASYGGQFAFDMQVMAAQGYLVLYVNPRGSLGYGEEFMRGIAGKFPIPDGEDIMDVLNDITQRSYVRQDQLYMAGGSGGGLLTTWLIAQHPDRFAAASAYYPVTDWAAMALTADLPSIGAHTKFFNDFPWEAPEEHDRRSPLTYVNKVKTPVILLTGEEDYRTPMSQSEMYFQALQLLDVESMLVRFPGSAHGFGRSPSHLIKRCAYTMEWFKRHAPEN